MEAWSYREEIDRGKMSWIEEKKKVEEQALVLM